MMSINKYLGRTYRTDYNCLDFARDVWLDLTGVDIKERLGDSLFCIRNFEKKDQPVDPCLVLMRNNALDSHIGIFVRGRILHIQEIGVMYQTLDIATMGYSTIGYYV